jgi:hypothetical protein
MEEEKSEERKPPIEPMPENASVTPVGKAKKTAFLSLFEMFGLSKLGEHFHEERESVKKVPLIILLCLIVGICLRGCWDDSKLESARDDLTKSEGAKSEAERDRDKYQTLYNQDENATAELRRIANEKFAEAPPDKRVDMALQKLDDIDSKIAFVSPLNQPIEAATVDIALKWKPYPKGGRGVLVVAFGSGVNALLLAPAPPMGMGSSGDGWQIQNLHCQVSSDSAYMWRPVKSLLDARYIQIEFDPPNSIILGGEVTWTINGGTVLRFEVPPQTALGSHIFILDLSAGLKPLSSTLDKAATTP